MQKTPMRYIDNSHKGPKANNGDGDDDDDDDDDDDNARGDGWLR
jgi:hypothetical protein